MIQAVNDRSDYLALSRLIDVECTCHVGRVCLAGQGLPGIGAECAGESECPHCPSRASACQHAAEAGRAFEAAFGSELAGLSRQDRNRVALEILHDTLTDASPAEYAEPDPPDRPEVVISREVRLATYEQRHADGLALYHPRDVRSAEEVAVDGDGGSEPGSPSLVRRAGAVRRDSSTAWLALQADDDEDDTAGDLDTEFDRLARQAERNSREYRRARKWPPRPEPPRSAGLRWLDHGTGGMTLMDAELAADELVTMAELLSGRLCGSRLPAAKCRLALEKMGTVRAGLAALLGLVGMTPDEVRAHVEDTADGGAKRGLRAAGPRKAPCLP